MEADKTCLHRISSSLCSKFIFRTLKQSLVKIFSYYSKSIKFTIVRKTIFLSLNVMHLARPYFRASTVMKDRSKEPYVRIGKPSIK